MSPPISSTKLSVNAGLPRMRAAATGGRPPRSPPMSKPVLVHATPEEGSFGVAVAPSHDARICRSSAV